MVSHALVNYDSFVLYMNSFKMSTSYRKKTASRSAFAGMKQIIQFFPEKSTSIVAFYKNVGNSCIISTDLIKCQ